MVLVSKICGVMSSSGLLEVFQPICLPCSKDFLRCWLVLTPTSPSLLRLQRTVSLGNLVKWTTLLIPPTTLIIVNMVGVVAGFSDALNGGYESWGPLFGKVFFAFWVIFHLYPFLKGLMGRQNRTPTIVVLWSVLLASVFSLIWVKINPFVNTVDSETIAETCIAIDC